MNDNVTKIKERLSILDVVSSYVELHKAGKNYKGKSPFTTEKTPSFYVSPDRGMYYCFSSNQGGDVFTFIEKMEGVDFKGALAILAEKAGVELVQEDPQKRDARDTQYVLIEDATKFFFQQGVNTKGAQDYVLDRGVSGKTIHTWRIGFAPDAWRSLREHLQEKGYTDAQIQSAGLIKTADGGKEPYDVFRNRIMFPIADNSGRIVAFSGRTLSQDKETPKYVNSPETEFYQKSDILFGYDKAKQSIRKFDFSILVEGQFDLVLAHQAGYSNTVAVSGTALTAHHIELLQRLSNRAVLALDSDRAGIAAVKRASGMMLARGMDVKVVNIEDGKDPADIIKEDSQRFKHMVGEALHVVEFLLSVLKRDLKDDRTYKLQVREEILPILARMPNRIDREHFENVIAKALETTKEGIHFEVERLNEEGKGEPADEYRAMAQEPVQTNTRYEDLVTYFLVMRDLLLSSDRKTLGEALEKHLQTLGITEEIHSDIGRRNKLAFTLEEEFSAYSDRQLREELSDRLTECARLMARRRAADIRSRIQEAERRGDSDDIPALIGEMTDSQHQLHITITL
ncbi:DNA primase [Candidatus Parcubacteria bacterium]|uniref:DNA primase n=1 Tax=Candidatus Kaiserbacteria bacterium CG10_big_fil_rev_8_21_14_0_10_47_16 TaxID=1974608 RepID=A0A2H0UDI0_9BACT|nr:DNA primase [Candidatus Parcubacteria bacterium]PIR84447.1 MAG: DNA primase [Candidatus Kaiserbacteria bacterium CG10_big_fil_rev_8_21_14_0_10_47_16]